VFEKVSPNQSYPNTCHHAPYQPTQTRKLSNPKSFCRALAYRLWWQHLYRVPRPIPHAPSADAIKDGVGRKSGCLSPPASSSSASTLSSSLSLRSRRSHSDVTFSMGAASGDPVWMLWQS